ncbi:MAG: pantothenate kinase, partial [Prevotella sp.]|nr:pantothenate kinase [Prevotella sp.]
GHDTKKEDIALGIICTVIQTICSGTVLASKGIDIKDFVMIGNLTRLPQTREIFNSVETLYGVHFIIPKHSEYCTAIGCCV